MNKSAASAAFLEIIKFQARDQVGCSHSPPGKASFVADLTMTLDSSLIRIWWPVKQPKIVRVLRLLHTECMVLSNGGRPWKDQNLSDQPLTRGQCGISHRASFPIGFPIEKDDFSLFFDASWAAGEAALAPDWITA